VSDEASRTGPEEKVNDPVARVPAIITEPSTADPWADVRDSCRLIGLFTISALCLRTYVIFER